MPTTRFQLIPFLISDHGRGKEYYVYTAKGRFKKGANRLCTTLYHIFRARKRDDHKARYARRVTLVADNFSENKNNTLLAFCSHLVVLGWFDEIVLAYGPPGHTHNGGDKQHQIHNEVLGNFTCVTFVHWLTRWNQAWRQEHSRPIPAVLDVQYNFDMYYRNHLDPIAGYTKTAADSAIVRGFRIARSANGVVTVQWYCFCHNVFLFCFLCCSFNFFFLLPAFFFILFFSAGDTPWYTRVQETKNRVRLLAGRRRHTRCPWIRPSKGAAAREASGA